MNIFHTDTDEYIDFAVTGTDVSGSANWKKYIAAKFYVRYLVDEEEVYIYSASGANNPDVYATENVDGVTVRCVAQILDAMAKAVYTNKDSLTAATYNGVAYTDKDGAEQTEYVGKTLAQGYDISGFVGAYPEGTTAEDYEDLLYFLIAYINAVSAVA